mmetsp:Transcript_34997/g.68102  ORF Transcript_34997/g.68102 Transcript_34997/m.68102 type:complete len:116 (-) Transcript_34997:34-381(-)
MMSEMEAVTNALSLVHLITAVKRARADPDNFNGDAPILEGIDISSATARSDEESSVGERQVQEEQEEQEQEELQGGEAEHHPLTGTRHTLGEVQRDTMITARIALGLPPRFAAPK